MTSNLGSHIIQERFEAIKDMNSAVESAKLEVIALLKKSVRPEFLNRIDDTIMFIPLNKENIISIVQLQLKGVTKMIAQQGITFDATKEAISYLAEKGFNPEYGACQLCRLFRIKCHSNCQSTMERLWSIFTFQRYTRTSKKIDRNIKT